MARRGAWRGAAGVIAFVAAAAGACAQGQGLGVSGGAGGSGTGGGPGSGGSGGMAADDGGDGSPPLEGGTYCGNQLHQVLANAPNLYFVFDASGSMGNQVLGGLTKYEIVEQSAVQMIETLGSLINVGAAVFPHGNGCLAGKEVFPVTPGDPVSPSVGPTTGGFIAATSVTPAGGTPMAATLQVLLPKLMQLKGRTVVILSTDGGPNCNVNITCAIDQCMTNIEGKCNGGTVNCCAPGGPSGPQECIDHDATVAAVAAITAAGIPVVVVGITGAEVYASVLNDMAKAGGAPQPGDPSYYRVDDLTMLTYTFQSIAASYISCDYVLQNPPADEDHTNVYFDGMIVLEDPVNGWVWKTPGEIELVGAACAALKSGMIKEVKILSGCPTQKAT